MFLKQQYVTSIPGSLKEKFEISIEEVAKGLLVSRNLSQTVRTLWHGSTSQHIDFHKDIDSMFS